MKKELILYIIFSLCFIFTTQAQIGFKSGLFTKKEKTENKISYLAPKEFIIDSLRVEGTKFLEANAIKSISGLKVGDKVKIPGTRVTTAMKKLWKQGLLGDVGIYAEKMDNGRINLVIKVKERPRLTKILYEGLSKTHESDINKKIDLILGRVLTDALVSNAILTIKKFLWSKAYRNVTVEETRKKDPNQPNSVILSLKVNKGKKVKINAISFSGNNNFSASKLRKQMKGTKEYPRIAIFKTLFKRLSKLNEVNYKTLLSREKTSAKKMKKFINDNFKMNFFSSSKLIDDDYRDDLNNIITFYNSNGYRDAKIIADTTYYYDKNILNIDIKIEEGKKYYFRNIEWKGNFIHSDKTLASILGVEKGDVYDLELINTKLNYNPVGADISSLYMDNGYLFFRINPIEKRIVGDSIDLEMRIFEGNKAKINKIIIKGNDRTNDRVIRREIRTLPGAIYSRAEIIRTHRELGALGFFNPETIDIKPIPNPVNETVDIMYTLEEKHSDQIELSGGWGGAVGFVGTVGIAFNNFSLRNFNDRTKWRPLPSGDGQKLAFRIQANGSSYQNYSISFSEPWLGGRKPNSFSFSVSHSIYRTGGLVYDAFGNILSSTGNYTGSLYLTSFSFGLGRRVKWPDDYFSVTNSLNMLFYRLDNFGQSLGFSTGNSRNFNVKTTIARNSSGPNALYPQGGSDFALSLTLTPPYSKFNNLNYETALPEEKYEWVEYHKWMFDGAIYTSLLGKLVLATRFHLGFIGSYSETAGIGPFERYIMGGSGLGGSNILVGNDIIGLRGYADNTITPPNYNGSRSTTSILGGVAFNKYVMELRYPVSLNPSATVYLQSFIEAGNNWYTYEDINFNKLYRSSGFGVRIFMPAFGQIGFDWAYGYDKLPSSNTVSGSQFHFTIGSQIR